MALLNENVQKQLKQAFADLTRPVKLVMFTQEGDTANSEVCGMCADTRQLLEEVAELSDKISLEVHDFNQEEAAVRQYNVDKVPAIAILGGPENKDYGIRFYGIPSGYEFGSLVEDILLASLGKTDLSENTLQDVAKLQQPVHIQVFTTPT